MSDRRRWAVSSALAALLVPWAVRGQSVFVPLIQPQSDQSAASYFSTNGVTAESVLNAANPDPESRNPLRWGPFSAHPRIDYQYINASGVRQGNSTVSTIQHVVTPGANLQLGSHWNLDGGVSLNYYTDPALQDSVGYNLGVHGGFAHEDWVYGVSIGLSASENSQIETAQQTKQQSYNVGLTATYGVGRRLSWDFSVNEAVSLTENLNKSYSSSTMEWLNYVVTPKTTIGLGLGGGYNMVESGAQSLSSSGTDSAYEQVQGRIVWRPLTKLSFSLTGGAQIQQFLPDNSVKTVVNPIFSASAGYSPFDGTSLSLSASRSVGNSILSDEFTESTSVGLVLSQRVLKYLTLTVSPSYGTEDFRSSFDPTGTANRTDTTKSINVSLSTMILRRINVSTFYSYSDHQSDVAFYSYVTRQFGVQVGYRF